MRCVLDTDEGRFGGHMRHDLGKTVFHHPKESSGVSLRSWFFSFFLGIYVYTPVIFFLGIVWWGGEIQKSLDVAEAWTMAMAIPSLQWVELIAAPTP